MLRAILVGIFAVVTTTDAVAQSVVLTEGSGRPLIVGDASELGAGLRPTAMAPKAIVEEFQRLCLPDPSGVAEKITNSPLTLASADVVFPASGKQAQAQVSAWRSADALLSVWTGDDANLKGRPIAITSRAYTTTGPYGPFKAAGVQCNLVIMVTDFAVANQLSEALSIALGSPDKLVAKNTFADGNWQIAGGASGIRINFTAPTTREGPQPVHLSAQIIEKGSKR